MKGLNENFVEQGDYIRRIAPGYVFHAGEMIDIRPSYKFCTLNRWKLTKIALLLEEQDVKYRAYYGSNGSSLHTEANDITDEIAFNHGYTGAFDS